MRAISTQADELCASYHRGTIDRRRIGIPGAYFLVIALLREADGGSTSAYAVLSMLPVFWLALYGTRRQLAVSIVGVASVFLMPLLIVGAPEYPTSEWTRALLWICVAPIVGFTVQSLVRQLRDRADEAARRAEELQISQEETRKLVVRRARSQAPASPSSWSAIPAATSS